MAFWCRIKQSKLKCLSHQFSRSYFQIPYNSSLNYTTSEIRTFVFGKNPVLITPKRPTFCINSRFFAAPVQVKPKQEEKDKSGPRLNEKITAQFIRLVVPDGEHLVVSRREALERAKKLKLDLVEVQRTADPPVCKLMDYHKEKYIKQVKEKERSRTKSKEVTLKKGDCKEVRFTVKTEQKDLQIKADTVKRLMERGYRVKCMAMGTEDQDLGGLLSRLSALIEDISMVESGPRVEKKQAYILVRHIKFGPSKKGGVKKLSKVVGTTSTEVERVTTASATIEASIPNQAPEQFDDDLTSAGSGSDTSDEIIIDDADTESDKCLEISRTTWSVSDTTDDFDKVFDFGDVKGATSHTTFEESTSAPEAAFSPANTHSSEVLHPKPILDSARANTVPSSPPKLPLETESRHAISEPRNRTQPIISMKNDKRGVTDFMRLEPQVPGQGKVPQSELNQSPTGPSFGTFSVPKVSAGHHGVATQLQRNKDGNSLDSTDPVKPGSHLPGQGMQQRLDKNVSPSTKHLGTNDSILRKHPLNEAPKQEQPRPGPPNSAASSYGIFSTSTTNAPSKLGTPEEINANRKGNPFDSVRKPNLRESANSSNPASNSEASQRQGVQGGFGIFSKENRSTNPSRTSE